MAEPVRVLLVEDDADIVEIVTMVLERAGLSVQAARTLHDARIALAGYALGALDAIVSDKNLPDGSGLTLLEEERKRGGDAELVVMTGYPSLDSAVQALRLGVYDYLEKPFRHLDDVVATVMRACQHRRVRRERDEARARAVLAERRATLVQVAAGLAHEVKNPLQGIGFACANTRAMLTEPGPGGIAVGEVLEQLDLVDAESRRLRDLVEGVMDLARPAPRPRARIVVDELVANVRSLHARRAEQAGVRIESRVDGALALTADEGDLSRALDNLVRNAVEIAPSGSVVVIDARIVAGALALEVSDQGPGFAPETRAQVFTPFFTTKARGFGLGLCQVAAAADRAGGSVEIQENIPKGARVILRIPLPTEGV